MQNILLQLDSDLQPSVFDAITALDSVDCVLLRHGGVTPENVVSLVHGCMFTRSPRELNRTAIFIGGSSMEASEKILDRVKETIWPPLNVSLMFDPNGSNTTAAAAVYNMAAAADMAGKRAVVLSGTGPVGQRAAGILLSLGASVLITSRQLEKAEAAADAIEKRFGQRPACAAMAGDGDLPGVLTDAQSVLCCGAAGVQLIPEKIWRTHPTLQVIADVNAVPPLGVEGTDTQWCGQDVDGKRIYGAIGIGGLKMEIHRSAIARMFQEKGQVLDTEGIYALAPEALKS